MTTQTNPQPSTPNDASAESMDQLRIVQRSVGALQRQSLAWLVVSALLFLASGMSNGPLAELARAAHWLALGAALFQAGRWFQSHRMEAWLRARLANKEFDWSTIPAASVGLSVRAYASVDEAAARGWRFGPSRGMFDGNAIPEWADMDGDRFEFEGLAPSYGLPCVPDDMRVFGRLRYRLRQHSQAPAAHTPAQAS